jgi:hypothetical protein
VIRNLTELTDVLTTVDPNDLAHSELVLENQSVIGLAQGRVNDAILLVRAVPR